MLYFFPGLFFILFSNFGSFMVILVGLGSWIRFVGLGFSFDWIWGLWCRAFWVFWGLGSLYKHRRITLGIKLCVHPTATVKSMTLGHMHIPISRSFCFVNSVWYVKPFKQISLFKKATIKNCSECTGRARIVRQGGHRSSNVLTKFVEMTQI